MISAKEARDSRPQERELMVVEERIKEAVLQGHLACVVERRLSEVSMMELIRLGYRVYPSVSDSQFTLVSWEEGL